MGIYVARVKVFVMPPLPNAQKPSYAQQVIVAMMPHVLKHPRIFRGAETVVDGIGRRIDG